MNVILSSTVTLKAEALAGQREGGGCDSNPGAGLVDIMDTCERWCAVRVRRARLEADVREVRKVRGRGARTAKGG